MDTTVNPILERNPLQLSWAELKEYIAAVSLQMKETDRRIEASRKETERLFRESLLRMDKADKKLRNLNGQFVSQTGHILEGMEIDLLYVDTTEAIAVEVKTQCTKSKIDHFLKQMRHFKRLYPRFADLEVYVAIAALNYAMDSESYARASLWCRDVVYRVPTVVYRVPTVVMYRVPTVFGRAIQWRRGVPRPYRGDVPRPYRVWQGYSVETWCTASLPWCTAIS